MKELKKINFEDGELAQAGYVMIDGVKHEIIEPVYNGATPINSDILNKMQNNTEQAINSINASNIAFIDGETLQTKYDNNELGGSQESGELPRYKTVSLNVSNWLQNTTTNKWEYTIQDSKVTEDYLVECHTNVDMGEYHTESYRGGFKIVASQKPEASIDVHLLIQKIAIGNNGVFLYSRNNAINRITEGGDYEFDLTLSFMGTGYLYNKETETIRTVVDGETLTDGEYLLSKTEAYGICGKVNLQDEVYTGPQTIIVEKPEIVVKATLRDAQGKLISNDINVINGYILNEVGVNSYSLVLEDAKGRSTRLDSIIVYIAEES